MLLGLQIRAMKHFLLLQLRAKIIEVPRAPEIREIKQFY